MSFGPTKTLCIITTIIITIIITLLENLTQVYSGLQFLNKFLKHCQQIQLQYPICSYELLQKILCHNVDEALVQDAHLLVPACAVTVIKNNAVAGESQESYLRVTICAATTAMPWIP